MPEAPRGSVGSARALLLEVHVGLVLSVYFVREGPSVRSVHLTSHVLLAGGAHCVLPAIWHAVVGQVLSTVWIHLVPHVLARVLRCCVHISHGVRLACPKLDREHVPRLHLAVYFLLIIILLHVLSLLPLPGSLYFILVINEGVHCLACRMK